MVKLEILLMALAFLVGFNHSAPLEETKINIVEIKCYLCSQCYFVDKYLSLSLHPSETTCPNVLKEYQTVSVNASNIKKYEAADYGECSQAVELFLKINPNAKDLSEESKIGLTILTIRHICH